MSGIERSGTSWLKRLIQNATPDHGGHAQPGKHAPPEEGQRIIFPSRNPYAWIDSMKRWLGDDRKGNWQRYLMYWGAGMKMRLQHSISVQARWEDFLHDHDAAVDSLTKRTGITELASSPPVRDDVASHGDEVHGDSFNTAYYLDGEHLESLAQELPQLQAIVEKKLAHVCDDLGYSTKPGENLGC